MAIRPAVEGDIDQIHVLIESIPGLWHPDWRLDVLARCAGILSVARLVCAAGDFAAA